MHNIMHAMHIMTCRYMREKAVDMAFVMWQLGLTDKKVGKK